MKILKIFPETQGILKTQAWNLSKTQETGDSGNPIKPSKRLKKSLKKTAFFNVQASRKTQAKRLKYSRKCLLTLQNQLFANLELGWTVLGVLVLKKLLLLDKNQFLYSPSQKS